MAESVVKGEIRPATVIVAGIFSLICLLALISNVIFFVYYRELRKNQLIVSKLQTDYKIVCSEFELFFRDRQHILQRQTITYAVESDFLESIPHSMQWTGDGYKGSVLTDNSRNKGYVLEEKRISGSIFNLSIKLPEKKQRGFSDTYSFETEIEDIKCKMLPVLGRIIKCKTEELCLKVTVLDGMIQKCVRFVSADNLGDIKLSPVEEVIPERVGEYWCYKWNITNLDLFRCYLLQWTFEDKL